MIWRPKPGQHVRIHYGQLWTPFCRKWQDRTGIVLHTVGAGLGNVIVRCDGGERAVIPRGNLIALPDSATGQEATDGRTALQ